MTKDKNKDTKYCKDCINYKPMKGLAVCLSSLYHDPVSGGGHRTCMIERIDGIGRCGLMANNFKAK